MHSPAPSPNKVDRDLKRELEMAKKLFELQAQLLKGRTRFSRLIRQRELCAIVGLSRWTINVREAEGRFPKRVKISSNAVGWYESDIAAWMANPSGWRASADGDSDGN